MPLTNKDLIKAAVADERQQFLQTVRDSLNRHGISDADRDEIIADIRTVVPDSKPAEAGKHDISVGFFSDGEEIFNVPVTNKNVSPERAAQWDGIYESTTAAADAQEPGGPSFNSTYYINDNGAEKQKSYTNAKQKAAGDVVLLKLLLAEAEAQLAA